MQTPAVDQRNSKIAVPSHYTRLRLFSEETSPYVSGAGASLSPVSINPLLEIQPQRDRAIIVDFDLHISGKTPCLNGAIGTQFVNECII